MAQVPAARGPGGRGRHPVPVAVRQLAAVRLRGRVHVRGRRPPGRAAGPGPVARPVGPGRAAGPRGAARADRPGRPGRPGAGAAAAHRRPQGPRRRRPARRPAAAGRPDRRRRPRPAAPTRAAAPGWLAELAATRRALRLRVGGRGALGRDRGRGPAPRRAWGPPRRSGVPAGVPRAGGRPAGRPGGPLRPHPRAVPGRRPGPPARPRRGRGLRRPWPGWRRPAASSRASSARAASGREWLDAEVLRRLRRRSLAALRREVEPVPQEAMARFLGAWQGVGPAGPRSADVDALFRVVEQLQGAAVPASALERQVLPARLPGYHPGLLDQLCASGEVVWAGVGCARLRRRLGRPVPGRRRPAAAPRARPGRAVALGHPGPRRPGRPGGDVLPPALGRRRLGQRQRAAPRRLGAGLGRPRHQRHPDPAPRPGHRRVPPQPPAAAPPAAATAAAASRRPAAPAPQPPPAAGAWSQPPPTSGRPAPTRPGGCTRWPSSCWTGTGC